MVRKILLTVIVLLIVAILGVLGIAATRPGAFHVERKATIAAPAGAVFALIDDFHRWPEWSPWEKLDPAMKRTYEGPTSGVSSSYAWVGNDKVGEGRMTISASEPDSLVRLKLEFLKPWTATNQVAFRLEPVGSGTEVTWSMDGTNNYMAKVFHVLMDVDQMIGKDFESGLANLKAHAEQSPGTPPAAPDSSSAGKS